tara:strand:- start:2107 stop:2766 length:660 start_codon:yes stop_codon:yes gene_type:complete
MNLNYNHARDLMVKNQLRPNKINEKKILELFSTIPKEKYVPKNVKNICYTDKNLTITNQRGYLKNLHLAQILNYSNIKPDDNVMHIGGLTGYFSTIISQLCKNLTIVEQDDRVLDNLNENIKESHLLNTSIVQNDLLDGCDSNAPYEVIIIDCPLNKLSNRIISQLNLNNGRLIYIKKQKDDLSKAYKLTKNNNLHKSEYLFDVFSMFEIDKAENEFIF